MRVFKIALSAVVVFNVMAVSVAQTDSILVQVADFRGQGYEVAGKAAFQASSNDVIVVLVCGAGQAVIDETKAALKGLINDGFTRVGMILSDEIEGAAGKHPIVAIIAGFDNPSYMEGVSVHAKYRVQLYQAVESAYQEYILSKIKD